MSRFFPSEVAPFAGAWIETVHFGNINTFAEGRALRGRVD